MWEDISFVPAFDGDKMEAWRDYAYYGGMPRILMEKDDQAKTASGCLLSTDRSEAKTPCVSIINNAKGLLTPASYYENRLSCRERIREIGMRMPLCVR